MVADNSLLLEHALDITFYDLPASASVRLDFPVGSGAEIPILTSVPAVHLGASYAGVAMGMRSFSITPRRLEFELENAPASLPLLLHIRFVGPGYWAVPLIQPEGSAATPKPVPTPRPAPAVTPSRSGRSSRSRPTPAPRRAARPAPAPTPPPAT